MGLAAFNRMRREQAKKAAERKTPAAEKTKAEVAKDGKPTKPHTKVQGA